MELRDRSHSVLIVEDERIVATDLQESLVTMGYDAFAIASTAEEALSHVSARCPDLILMDIRIKGKLDGIETATILRRQFDIPVVYLTAHADDATMQRARATTPFGYLLKPVRTAELRSAIELSLYRHQMERRLRERERWFSTTLRSIADAVIAVDLAGNVTFMNPAAERITGVAGSDVVGRPARDVVRLFDEHARPQESPLDRALREGQPSELLEAYLATGDVRRVIGDSAAPVTDDGELLGAVMVFRDLTEQRALRRQLELADRLASLGTMAAGVAHELNNPLAVVVANAAFVRDELANARAALASTGGADELAARLDEALLAQAELQTAAARMSRIVADLRAFARPTEAGPHAAELRRTVDWAVRTTAHELRDKADVVTDLPALPPIRADEMRLGQVFVNLLINAAQAMPSAGPRGRVEIRARVEGDRVVVEVRDTGTGMAPETMKRIFEPFFTTKPVGVGTGLGLSICHGIVHSLGGTIDVDSVLGRGTTFRLTLPAVGARPHTAEPAYVLGATSRRARILAIDDETMVLKAIRRILREHDVVCCASASDAVALLNRGEQFDVILSDIMMPVMGGIELYEALLARDPALTRRLIFVSGGATTQRVEAFLKSIPNLLIEKPFDKDDLLPVVARMLGA